MTIIDPNFHWIPLVIGFWGQLIGLAAGPLLGKLFGGSKSNKIADTLIGEGQQYGGMAKGLIGDATSGFKTVGSYLNPLVAGNPNALAEWTSTTAADEARRTGQIARQAGAGARSGATAAATLGAYQNQRSSALSNRIQARMQATQALTDLSSRQGQLGLGTGGLSLGAYGGANDAYRTSVYKAQGEQGLWKDIGGGLYDILNGKFGKSSTLGKPGDWGGETNNPTPIPGTDMGGYSNTQSKNAAPWWKRW